MAVIFAASNFVQTLLVRQARSGKQEVLLGRWKVGAPLNLEGRYTGLLGEMDTSVDASLEEAAVRHAERLAGVTVDPLRLHERARFVFDGDFVEHEFVYNAGDAAIAAVETDSMTPVWFTLDDIPYDEMPADDEVWYPPFFRGTLMQGYFNFCKENPLTLDSFKVVEVSKIDDSGGIADANDGSVLYQKG